MSQNKSVAFTNDLNEGKNSPARSPPIAAKLLKTKLFTSSIEEIEQKLRKAEENRKEEFARKAWVHTDEKLTRAHERKTAMETDLANKYTQTLEHKAATAE